MKNIVLLLALAGIVSAGRPDAENVIATFKRIAPIYKASIDEAQSRVSAIKSNITNQLVNFHLEIILTKAQYVQQVIVREDYILEQINVQRMADMVCLDFVRTSSEMNVNLAGVSFTNCINTVDDAVRTKMLEYYGTVGDLERKLQQLRLLDVFRGHNVFHSPQPIIAKLNAKLAFLQDSNSTVTEDDTKLIANNMYQDLFAVGNGYKNCLAEAYGLLAQGLNMCETQMQHICGATLQCEIGSGPCAA